MRLVPHARPTCARSSVTWGSFSGCSFFRGQKQDPPRWGVNPSVKPNSKAATSQAQGYQNEVGPRLAPVAVKRREDKRENGQGRRPLTARAPEACSPSGP